MNKQLIRKILIRDMLIATILGTYTIVVIHTNWGIPCVIHLITGLQCPGCGISRMLLSMLHGDFYAAFSFHPFLFVTWPVLLYLILKTDYLYVTGQSVQFKKADTVLACLYIIALVLFSVVRNLL